MEYTLVFLPLLGAIMSGFFGRYIGERNSEIITSFLVSISALTKELIKYTSLICKMFARISQRNRSEYFLLNLPLGLPK